MDTQSLQANFQDIEYYMKRIISDNIINDSFPPADGAI